MHLLIYFITFRGNSDIIPSFSSQDTCEFSVQVFIGWYWRLLHRGERVDLNEGNWTFRNRFFMIPALFTCRVTCNNLYTSLIRKRILSRSVFNFSPAPYLIPSTSSYNRKETVVVAIAIVVIYAVSGYQISFQSVWDNTVRMRCVGKDSRQTSAWLFSFFSFSLRERGQCWPTS